VRWADTISEIEEVEQFLAGDVLLASAFISYIGPFTKQYRDRLIQDHWVREISISVHVGGTRGGTWSNLEQLGATWSNLECLIESLGVLIELYKDMLVERVELILANLLFIFFLYV